MAIGPFLDAVILLDGVNISGNTNQVSLSGESTDLDATTFASGGWQAHRVGAHKVAVEASGFNDYNAVDEAIYTPWAARTRRVVTVVPAAGAEGDRAYSLRMAHLTYSQLGAVDEMMPFALSGQSYGILSRNTVIHAPADVETIDGNGTAFQLGALSATQTMYVAIHLTSISAGTTNVIFHIESDTSGFGSATGRATSATFTAVGSEWIAIAGAVTDDYWRVRWDVTGASPSVDFVVTAGIG
jgi:hypothetical protein